MTEEENFLEDCYRKYYTSILNLCRREVNHNPLYADVIDTCIQDTFLLAYSSYAQIKDYTNIRAWLVRACLNRLLPYIKLQKKRQEHEAFSLDDERIHPTDNNLVQAPSFETAFEADKLQEIACLLSPKEKLVFKYYFIEGHSADEVASLVHCSPSTIRVLIFRIRQKSKKISRLRGCALMQLLTTNGKSILLFTLC